MSSNCIPPWKSLRPRPSNTAGPTSSLQHCRRYTLLLPRPEDIQRVLPVARKHPGHLLHCEV
jgi:hypothetical protein